MHSKSPVRFARVSVLAWQKRWTATAQDILDHEVNLTGDIFLSAAFVSYLGAFTGPFRNSLVESWTVILRDKGIRVSDGFSLAQVKKRRRCWNWSVQSCADSCAQSPPYSDRCL